MRKFSMQSVSVQSDVLCDICGQSCMFNEMGISQPEYLEMKASWGYFAPWDNERWTADICIECVKTHLLSLVKFQGREL